MSPVASVALLGAAGFVGAAIQRALARRPEYVVLPVTRHDDCTTALKSADIVIHSANPARRFQAESDPRRDFEETVDKTVRLLKFSSGKPFLLISTLSCRTQVDTTYGRHRLACEDVALALGASVTRLGPMFGRDRTRDSLHDLILGRPIYVSAATRYAYVDVDWAAEFLVSRLQRLAGGVTEIGAGNTISLGQIAQELGSGSRFAERDDTQFPLNFDSGPPAELVLDFARAEIARIAEWASLGR